MRCVLCGNPEISSYSSLFNPHQPCQTPDGESCIPCRKMEQLESQILQARIALAEMVEQHDELKTEINHMHNPIIHRVPPEIASSIFEFCTPSELPSHSRDKANISTPLVLGAVCRTWRQITWSTPRLWTSITLSLSFPRHQIRLQLAQQWLSRSGQLPLSISIYAPDVMPTTAIYPMIDLVNQYSSRWRHIDISVHSILLPRFSGNPHGVSILQTLRLHSYDYDRFGGQFLSDNAQPSPSNVQISNIPFKSANILWNNVTYVEADYLQIDECLELLRCAPKIKDCKFYRVRRSSHHFRKPENLIVCHQLRGLHFLPAEHVFDLFFDNITLPSLESLSFSKCGRALEQEVLVSFLKRSACHLSHLSMMNLFFNDADLVSIFRATPFLQNLRLSSNSSSSYLPDNFFELLGRTTLIPDSTSNEEAFLPLLKRLEYDSNGVFEWKHVPDIFGALSHIESVDRRPLNSLEILHCQQADDDPYIDRETLSRLVESKNAGINLRLFDEYDDQDWIQVSADFHGIDLEGRLSSL